MFEQFITTDYTKCLNLLKKLAAILKAVDYIEKDARNNNANYNYASEKAIKIAMHEAFTQANVLMFVSHVIAETMDVETKDATVRKIMTTRGLCTFVDPVTGESITMAMLGSGNGRDDKGIYAALTGIIKYALTSTFLVPTGDDAERDEAARPTFRVELPPEKQEAPAQPPAQPPAKKEEAPAQPPAKKTTKKEAAKPVTEAPKNEKRADFGNPRPESPVISAATVEKMAASFTKLGITKEELEMKAGYPLTQWTDEMAGNCRIDFQALKQGRCTAAQFMASVCVAVDFPPKGGDANG